MQKTLKFSYEDSMDLLNALETLAKTLPAFGVKLEILEGGDGYEEVCISCNHIAAYYNVPEDNFYCCQCKQGMGQEYYERNIKNKDKYPTYQSPIVPSKP